MTIAIFFLFLVINVDIDEAWKNFRYEGKIGRKEERKDGGRICVAWTLFWFSSGIDQLRYVAHSRLCCLFCDEAGLLAEGREKKGKRGRRCFVFFACV